MRLVCYNLLNSQNIPINQKKKMKKRWLLEHLRRR